MSEIVVDKKSENQNVILAKAELDTQISTAKAYPRDVSSFVKNATFLATLDHDTAESCFYSLPPRKDKKTGKITIIQGPSIRLAEIASSTWGNIHCASRLVSNDGKTIVVEAVAWDLERNVRVSKQASKSIQYSGGGTYSTDMQVVTSAAAQSIALRNAILSVVPQALVDRVYEAAKRIAVGDQKSLPEKVQKVLATFNKNGYETSRILTFLEIKTIQEFTLEHVELLIGLKTALVEGRINKDQVFNMQDDSVVGLNPTEKLKHMLDAKKSQEKQKED